MNVRHVLHGESIIFSNCDNPQFMLKNKKGEFLFFSTEKNISNYNGLYIVKEGEEPSLFKTIDEIKLLGTEVEILTNNFNCFERESRGKEKFYFDENGMIYEIDNYKGMGEIHFDTREIYDYSNNGRNYEIYTKKDLIIIKYLKIEEGKEKKYEIYTAVKGIKLYEKPNEWIKKNYEYDSARKSPPYNFFVYNGIRFEVDGKIEIRIASDFSEEKAIQKIAKISRKSLPRSDKDLAFVCAKESIKNFFVDVNGKKGIYAGLPWFFQFWTRDEAISLGAFINLGMYNEVKDIIFRHLDKILDNGRISNRFPFANLGSADGVGWVFKRAQDLIEKLESIGKLNEYISMDELGMIKEKLAFSIERTRENYFEKGLIRNFARETWMDTDFGNDTRDGYRIEIQALYLNMLKFFRKICWMVGEEVSNDEEEEIKRNIRDEFFDGRLLADGLDDYTIRPNVFLAYYVYPELLKRSEWEIVFDNTLEALWCEWGGLSTIDKSSSLFCADYSGQDNRSYHRGDSWFFVNNITAITLNDINREKYKEYINKIIEANEKEILSLGIIGESSELSSASQLKSEGCLAQAWSSSTFVELVFATRR